MKGRRILPLTAAWFCFCNAFFLCAAEGKKVEHRKHNTAYSDPLTGKTFPAQIGTFAKTMVRVSPNTVLGTRICYGDSAEGGKADIYIYSLQEDPSLLLAQKEFEEHKKQILSDFAGLLKKEKRFSRTEKLSPEEFYFTVSGRTFRTGLYLFPCGKYIIKVCLTLPAESWQKAAPPFRKQLQKLLSATKTSPIVPTPK